MSRPMTRSMWRPLCAGLAVAFAGQALVPSSLALAQPNKTNEAAPPQDLIAKGRQLFEDQRYEESIQALSAALVRPDNTKEQKVEIYRLLALDYITLGRKEEADSAVRGLLVEQPDYDLPPSESPRFRDFFAEARARWEAEGRPGLVKESPARRPVVLRHSSPASARKNEPIVLRAKLEDPDRRASSVTLHYRAGSRGEFATTTAELKGESVRARIPASVVRPPVIDYYFEVLDEGGAVVASRGDAQAPLRIAIPNDSAPGWVVPLAIGGGILGAAAIVGGLALAGVFDGPAPPAGRGPATVTVHVGEAGLRW